MLASEVHIHLLHMYDNWFMVTIDRTIVKLISSKYVNYSNKSIILLNVCMKKNIKKSKMNADLQSGINGEATSGGVHAGHILGVVDLLKGQLGTVVPMAVVNVLSDQGVGLHREVLVHLS